MATPAAEESLETLHHLKALEPARWLAPSPDLSRTVRAALSDLFSCIKPFCPKSPFERLLIDGFDAEQIWQQGDLQSKTLLPTLIRELNRFEKNPREISKLFAKNEKLKSESEGLARDENLGVDDESDGGDEVEDFEDMEDVDDEEDDEDGSEENGEEEDDGGEDGEGEEEEEEEGGGGGIEDKFFKMGDLEEYLEKAEEEEYGLKDTKNRRKVSNEDDEEEDEEDEEEEDELGLYERDVGDDGDMRYEDFFGKKKTGSKRNLKSKDEIDDIGAFEQADDKRKEGLSTHEKELQKMRAKIQEMEKANLEPKDWTLRGEVTANKRPKNSALEVDLDFEQNLKPPPVITEEITASLEDLIHRRVVEARFDDVQRARSLPSKAPKEVKEMDENKSKKGLGEIYEDEYVQTTGLGPAASSFSDEQKKEATMLFKTLCLKLDALSHFHFSPKPIIEDMSVQVNVPALAMEEVAPVMVSDANMLAPEEVFAGKGDIKEETELTKAERKRRRASNKRKFKRNASKRLRTKEPQTIIIPKPKEGKET